MNESEFFIGTRQVDQFTDYFHGGKARLTCTIMERWEEVLAISISCGLSASRKLTRHSGVHSLEKEDLESVITGSLGLKGIVEFKTEIKGKTGRELGLEEFCEVEEAFNFTAPECGRFTVRLYQLTRLYELSFQDDRFMHRARWRRTIREWVNRIHDASNRIKNDPVCGCDDKPETGIDGVLYLSLGRISMFAAYKRTPAGLEFPDLSRQISFSVEEVTHTPVIFDQEQIPPYLRFLADEQTQDSFFGVFSSQEKLFAPRTTVESEGDPEGHLTNRADIDRQIERFNKLLEYELSEEAAFTDALTGLANRRRFEQQLEREVARSLRYRHPLCLLLLDIDYFKLVNDKYGYKAGDEVLKRLGRTLQARVRGIDLAARVGGEQFAVILPETELKHGVLTAERLLLAIKQTEIPLVGRITASFGVAEFPLCARDANEVFAVAKAAMYEAKQRGRDRISRAITKSEKDHADVLDT